MPSDGDLALTEGRSARAPRLFAAVAIGAFVLDQATKLAVIGWLDLPAVGRIDVASPYLTFLMAWNTGINFGLFGGEGLRWALVGIAVAVSLVLGVWALRRGTPGIVTGAALVVGGALGNALDRVIYGAVADFLNMSCCGIQNPYAFNVADVAIFLGAIVIAWKA